MFRHKIRWKDGKEHRYFSVVENKRAAGGRVVQRHVLYLGEINDTRKLLAADRSKSLTTALRSLGHFRYSRESL